MDFWVEQVNERPIFWSFDEGGQVGVAFSNLLNFIEKDRFPNTTQTKEHLRLRRTTEKDALKRRVGCGNDFLSTGQLRWLRARPWRKRISDRVHI